MVKRLQLLNGAAILCVILFHASGFGYTAMFSWAHRYRPVVSPNYDEVGTAAYYALRLVEQFVTFAIPAFLFVSGFFISVLTSRSRATVDSRTVRARIKGLAIPYLLWSGIVLVGLALEGRVFSEARYARFILTGSSNPNYYYVPMLVQLYLVAPFIVRIARWNWKALLLATGALQVCVYALQYLAVVGPTGSISGGLAAAVPKWLFLVHLFWFTSGVVAGFQQHVLKAWLARVKWILVPCVLLTFVLGVVEWELLLEWSGSPWRENRATLIDGFYAGSLILSFLAFTEATVPFSQALVSVGGKSYGIYLVHGLVMEYFSRGLYHVAPWVLAHQILFQPLLILLGLSVPLILMGLLNRSPFRDRYTYVFG